MKVHAFLLSLFLSAAFSFSTQAQSQDQDQQPDVMWKSGGAQGSGGQERTPRGGPEGRGRPVFGKITALASDSVEVTGPDGNKVTLKLTSSTEYRKDRQPAKLSDLKVGDPVVVRTDQPDGKGNTAVMVVSGKGYAMRGGPGQGGGPMMLGTIGKDFVAGEVKAVDPPKLTVLRTDNVTQTLELNEETSLRRGRDSITMADIQVGDHVVARGAMENNVFVPKNLNVVPSEMWKLLEEMMAGGGAVGGAAQSSPAPPPSQQNPPEHQN